MTKDSFIVCSPSCRSNLFDILLQNTKVDILYNVPFNSSHSIKKGIITKSYKGFEGHEEVKFLADHL